MNADPKSAKSPIGKNRLARLSNVSRWLYGTGKMTPLVHETHQISDLGTILESALATKYLESTDQPKFSVACQLAGGHEPELVRLLTTASDRMEEALRTIRHFTSSREIQKAVKRIGADSLQLLSTFPSIRKQFDE